MSDKLTKIIKMMMMEEEDNDDLLILLALLLDNRRKERTLEHDMENYIQYKIMGSVKRIRLKPGCIPARFDWNRKHKFVSNESHFAEAKSIRISITEDSVKDHIEGDNIKALSSCVEDSQTAADVPSMKNKYDKAVPVNQAQEHEETQVENDTENLVKYRLVGGTLKLKANACPHKFECQQGTFEQRRRIEFYEIPRTLSQSSSVQSFEMIEYDKIDLNETEDPLQEDITFTESVPDNNANKKSKKLQKEESSPSGNESKVFCPNCNTEVQHTAEGIQEDQTKILIAKVYHYLESEYEELKKLYGGLDLTPLSNIRQRTALATGVSETTVFKILRQEDTRNTEKREEKKRRRARKRFIKTESDSSSEEESSDDNVSDGGRPSYEQEAQNEADLETLVVKLEEPEIDIEHVQIDSIPVEVKTEPPDDDVNYTNDTLALTEPAAIKRKGRKVPRRSDVTSTRQHSQGEPSTSAASSRDLLMEVLDQSGLLGETEVKEEQIEIEEGFS